jgi:hypothetical protein
MILIEAEVCLYACYLHLILSVAMAAEKESCQVDTPSVVTAYQLAESNLITFASHFHKRTIWLI